VRYKITFLSGVAVGYVFGARAGRERYEKLKTFASQSNIPAPVQKAYKAASERAREMVGASAPAGNGAPRTTGTAGESALQ
jgi:hypothetical protein